MIVFIPESFSKPQNDNCFASKLYYASGFYAQNLRNQIERNICLISNKSNIDELISRIKSSSGTQSKDIIGEILIFGCLKILQWKPQYEVRHHGKTPDYKITIKDKTCILELFHLHDEEQIDLNQKLMNRLAKEISKEKTLHGIWIEEINNFTHNTRLKRFLKYLSEKYEEINRKKLAKPIKDKYEEKDFSITFTIWPYEFQKPEEPYLGDSGDVFWIKSIDRILNSLNKKKKNYFFPFIPVLLSDSTMIRRDHIIQALYGREAYNVQSKKLIRTINDEFFTYKHKHEHIPGLIAIKELQSEENGNSYKMELFHNPFVREPIPLDYFKDIDQFLVIGKEGRKLEGIKWYNKSIIP